MKIRIENFGPVAAFEFDSSKSMHLIVGSNNVGKSYALTAYYFAVKALLDFAASIPRYMYQHDFIEEDSLFDKKLIDELHGKLKDKKSTNIDASKVFIDTASVFLKITLAEIFTGKLRSSFYEFETIANQFSRSDSTKIIFDLRPFKFTLKGDLDEFKVTDVDFDAKIIIRTIKQNRAAVMRGKEFVIYRNENEKNEDVLNKIRRLAIQHATAYIIVALEEVADINYLPASRSGLYQALSAFSLIIAELSKNRSFITSKIELPGISGQLSDYFIKLAGISEENRSHDPSFESLAREIESTVLRKV